MFFGKLKPKLLSGKVTTCSLPITYSNSPYRVFFGTREHRSTLDESFKTFTYIDFYKFRSLLQYYHFYCFDVRFNQFVFLINYDDDKHPTWLFLEIFYYKVN